MNFLLPSGSQPSFPPISNDLQNTLKKIGEEKERKEKEEERKVERKEEKEKEKDGFEQFPSLVGVPKVGNIIAFKVFLSFSSSFFFFSLLILLFP
jgi:ERCC4-type nuclease